MRVLSDALTEKDELHQTIKYYEALLTEELVVQSHLHNAMKIKELREKLHYYKAEYDGYVNGSRTLCG